MRRMQGRIIIVQEDRFRIVDREGRSFLFDLAHNADVTSRDLLDWSRAKVDLTFEYEGEPETDTGVVHSVRAF